MQPGDLVVCVNNRPVEGCGNDNLRFLTLGHVYTVRSLLRNWPYGLGVRLREIALPRSLLGLEQAYWAERFRPCRPTSIAIFEQMLHSVPADLSMLSRPP
ncbi:MAG TPA: hypothetical protein VKA03_03915 [Methylovirgula sp.]|nr:hypothetical protein [Methylovirgula sp.]